jgi:hypothetical protein
MAVLPTLLSHDATLCPCPKSWWVVWLRQTSEPAAEGAGDQLQPGGSLPQKRPRIEDFRRKRKDYGVQDGAREPGSTPGVDRVAVDCERK